MLNYGICHMNKFDGDLLHTYQRSKLFSSKLKNYMEKISVQLKKIRGIFSAQTLVILLGRSCCTHIYCMTSEKHHKTSQVEKSHTQYK